MLSFGQDRVYNDLLEKQAEMARNVGIEFLNMSRDLSNADTYSVKMKKMEEDADTLTHELTNRADRMFITPYDKEDIRGLSMALDDITDLIEAAAGRVSLFKLREPRPELIKMAEILAQASAATAEGVSGLRNHIKDKQKMHQLLTRIHEIENSNDEVYRHAIGAMFTEPEPNPLTVMKWKEIYDRIELAIDKCESVAVILEGMVVKYA